MPEKTEVHELAPVTVEAHGTIGRGRSDQGPGGTRPHVFLWFRPAARPACREYFWYQFARPRLLVEGEEETDEVRRFAYETSGGATMKMGEWRPDYIQEPLNRVDAAREAAGRSKLPEFRPPGLKRSRRSTRRPRGKAYIGPSIPGHGGDGIVDAPNLCYRGPDPTARTISNISRVYREYLRDVSRVAVERPGADSQTVSVVVEFRSYLVCVAEHPQCIGYVEWSYVTRTRITYEWRPTEETHLGTDADPRRWCPWPIERGDCEWELIVGDFRAC
jgi:hypothetical protein